jgi:hypothetical protein
MDISIHTSAMVDSFKPLQIIFSVVVIVSRYTSEVLNEAVSASMSSWLGVAVLFRWLTSATISATCAGSKRNPGAMLAFATETKIATYARPLGSSYCSMRYV